MASPTYAFTHGFDYASIVAASEHVAWTVDAIFRDRRFDASKPIVPASWVRTQELTFLTGPAHAQPLSRLQLCASEWQL
jgi:hypothetical protein